MEQVLQILSWIFILSGSFFYLMGTAGLLRMPDVFTRMHAASVSDTMGASLLLIGMMFQAGVSLVLAKLFMLWFFILFTGPVATHALARAARYAGVEPALAKAEPKRTTETKPAPKKSAPARSRRKVAAKTTPERKTARTAKGRTKAASPKTRKKSKGK